MPNSDNAYGTFNKRTQILSQIDDGSTALVNHASVDAAKSFFYTAEALAVFDECCTQLEWAIVDSTKLKYTMAFGTKGGNIAAEDDWAGQFNSRKTALINSAGWSNGVVYTTEESNSHLF
jgi:hypothetical protein